MTKITSQFLGTNLFWSHTPSPTLTLHVNITDLLRINQLVKIQHMTPLINIQKDTGISNSYVRCETISWRIYQLLGRVNLKGLHGLIKVLKIQIELTDKFSQAQVNITKFKHFESFSPAPTLILLNNAK